MELPELSSAVRRHLVHLRRIQAGIANGLARPYRPAVIGAGGVPTHDCAPRGRAARG